MSTTQTTTDHDTIRQWAEERDGKPATVSSSGRGDAPGILRIDFPGYSGTDSLEEVPWDAFFEKFDSDDLQFLYQEETADGSTSRFCKFVRNPK